MDKPAKTRRRRSIRNLRASTGFHSPPLPSAPYGSAWIEQDLETNMDNLVLSLSQLQSKDDDNDDDSGEKNIQEIPKHPLSVLPFCGNSAADVVNENASLTLHAQACAIIEGASQTDSNAQSMKHFGLFSLSPDMPLGANSSGEECHFVSSIANVAQSTPSRFFFCHEMFEGEKSQDLSHHEELLRDDEENNEHDCADSNSMLEDGLLDYLEGEKQTQTDMSLNFSPVPEQDKTIDCLVRSLHDNFDVSFSPQGVRPDTPELSPLIPFNPDATKRSSFQESLHDPSPTSDIPSSFFRSTKSVDVTYTLDSVAEESPVAGNDSHNVFSLDGNIISSASKFFQNRTDERNVDDKSEDLRQPQDSVQAASVQESSGSSHLEAPNTCDETDEYELGGAVCFSKFVGDMSLELERIVSKKVRFSEIVSDDIDTLPGTNADGPSALSQLSDHCSENVVKSQTSMAQPKKKSNRRSSRQFTIQEFSVAFEEPVKEFEQGVNSLPVCQGTLDSKDGLSEGLSTVHVDGDASQNQKEAGKTKRGRRSGSFSKGNSKTKNSSQKKTVTPTTDDSLVLKPRNRNSPINSIDDPTSKGDHISQSVTVNWEENGHDDDQQNENIPLIGSKARRNRKSWGDAASRRAAAVKQKRVAQKKKQPQAAVCLTDDTDGNLEQFYTKQKYVPVKCRGLETIKETANTQEVLFGKQKTRRSIIFPEDYNPTTVKLRFRRKRALKHQKKPLQHTPIDYNEFLIRLNAIELDLDSP